MKFVQIKYKNGKFDSINIRRIELTETLKSLGFYALDYQNTVQYVRIQDNKIELTNTKKIQDHFLEYYLPKQEPLKYTEKISGEDTEKELHPLAVKEKFYQSLNTYFSDQCLNRLFIDFPINYATDTADTKYMYFQNKIVEITAKGHKAINWKTIEGKTVFADQILQREYHSTQEVGNFEKFCQNICRTTGIDEKAHNGKAVDPERFKALQCIIGYLLHSYFDKSLKAIVLTDSRIGSEGEPNGRSGKSLIGKAIGRIMNRSQENTVYCEIDGKSFDPREKGRYEKANIDTKLVHINDLQKNFDIDNLYTAVTEGFFVKKLYLPAFEVRAKLLLSTNKTLNIRGDSDVDRFFQFELADYYSASWKVDKEFQQWFFTEWDAAEWNRFDNFMIKCVKLYLQNGLIEPEPINLGTRMLNDHTCPEFVNYMNDYFIHKEILQDGKTEYAKKPIYEDFKEKNTDFDNPKFTQRKFTSWVRSFCKHKGIVLSEPRRNGMDYFVFS